MNACPCHSGERYSRCCKPFHDGSASPPTPEALMRSRYSAFSLGLGDYLVATLASTYPDRSKPVRDPRQRFAGLRILDAKDHFVTFRAKIYVGGADHSFTERSRFVREDGHWRYADGEFLPEK